jgi:pyruvate dehydrogenase E2 component (dihydrolipoamide acetyltransferase)
VLKAVARALVAHPRLNSVLDGNDVIYRKAVNIGVAVATPQGLVVPVLRGADKLALTELASRSRELAVKARDRTLSPGDFEGGTFTVSNIGMYGVTMFTPIINPPQAAILGVCAVEEELKLIAKDGKASGNRALGVADLEAAIRDRTVSIEAHQVMGLSLTFDHRVLDGVEAAVFLQGLKNMLENPLMSLI